MSVDIGPKIGIDGEAKFRQEIRNITQQIKTLQAETKAVTSAFTAEDNEEKKLTATQKALSAQIVSQKEKIALLKKGLQESSQKYGDNHEKTLKWQQAVHEATAGLNDMERELKQTQGQLQNVDKGQQQAEKSTRSWSDVLKGSLLSSAISSGFQKLDSQITNLGKKFASFMKSAVSENMDFDAAMSQVAATMGKSVDQIDDLRETAKQMGAETKFTATEAAEGLNILAQSGLDAKNQIAAIPTVLNLAAAGNLSLESSASYVTASVKGFKDEMANAGYYADLMAKGATMANTSVAGLGEALGSGAATFSGYNQSAESVTVQLLRLAEQNVTGAEAATALGRAMKDIYTPTSKAKEALEALGISAYDAQGNTRDFGEIVDELKAALAGMSQEEQNAYKNTIFTTYGLNAFNKMTAASAETVNKFADGLANSAGAAAEQAATQIDNLKGDVTIFNSALDGAKLSLSEGLTPALRDIVQQATKALSSSKMKKGLKSLGEGLGSLAKAGANLAKSVLPRVLRLFDDGAKKLKILVPIIASVGLAIKAAINPVGTLVTAVWLLSGGLAFLALTADDTSEYVVQLTESEQELEAKTDAAAESYRELKDTYASDASAILDETKKTQDLWKELQTLADESGNVKDADVDRANYLLGELNKALGTEFEMNGNIIEQYDDMKAKIADLILQRQAEALLTAKEAEYNAALEARADAVQKVGQEERLLNEQTRIAKAAQNEYNAAYERYLEVSKTNNAAAIEAATDALNDATLAADAANTALKERQQAYDNAISEAGMYYSTISNYEAAQAAAMEGNYKQTSELLTSDISAWTNYYNSKKTLSEQDKQDLAEKIQAEKDTLDGMKKMYREGVDGVTAEEIQKHIDTLNELQAIWDEKAGAAEKSGEETVKELGSGMSAEASSVTAEAEQIGANIGEGIKKGIKSKEQAILDTAGSVAGNAMNRIRNVAQIASPSKITTGYGEYIGEGLIVGLQRRAAAAKAAASEYVRGVLGALNGGQIGVKGLSETFDWSSLSLQSVAFPTGTTTNNQRIDVGGITMYVNAGNVENVSELADLVADRLNRQIINLRRAGGTA